MTLKLTVSDIRQDLRDAFLGYEIGANPGVLGAMTRAITAAMQDAGAALKTKGRAAIKSGGLGAKFANAWRVNVYPSKGAISLTPAAYGYHAIPYSLIFQTGGVIGGKHGLLWLPLPTVPKVGRRIARPRDLVGVKLFSINGHGKPLLAAKIRKQGVNANSRIRGQVSLAALRAGTNVEKIRNTSRLKAKQRGGVKAADARAGSISVPLFVGVSSVNLRSRFNLQAVADDVANQLPAYYDQRLKV